MTTTEIWMIESPVAMIEEEVIPYSWDFLGASKVETPSVTVYKDEQDITSAVMISGDDNVVSGNVVTIKKITAKAGHGGERYVVVLKAEVDSHTEKRKLLIEVVKPGAES